MSISVNPILPVIAAPSVAPDLVLQPGSVINAQVLKVLSGDLVRIAISNLAIDVLTEIPLVAGQALQLAVSQTAGGIRLALVGGGTVGTSTDTVTLSPGGIVDALNSQVGAAAVNANTLTPPERVALSAAAQTAATQQESLAPLFANLGAVAASNGLPPQLQQAVIQLLAQRTTLDQNLTGNDIKNAFQKSGLLLEASLASGTVSAPSGVPDLKAALIVLRQTLLSSQGAGDGSAPSASVPRPVLPSLANAAATLAPLLAEDALAGNGLGRIVLSATPLNVASRTATADAALNLLQEVLQEIPREARNTSLATVVLKAGSNDDVTVRTNTPPPPFRGALPSTQPIASPSIAPHSPLATTVSHLLGDTEGAIARQILLQVASLPNAADTTSGRLDPTGPRWNFEIPFATPQGTAIAQFEIARDGGGSEVEAAKRVWRARFSLDVEPAGPVHALVSLSGERTSVRMWAERPATAAQLRAGAVELSQALSKAELRPGDIVIRDGTPPQSASPPAGHFLDRAL
jgi:hypothetical protein